MSTPKTNLVVLVGGSLLAANLMYDKQFNGVRQELVNGQMSTETVTGTPIKMALVGLLTLVALTVISDDSDSAATTILIALGALWILWLFSHEQQKSAGTTTNTGTSAAKAVTKLAPNVKQQGTGNA